MWKEVAMGAPSRLVGDASDKVILLRGCDPVMADGSKEFLPPFLENAVIVTTTDDAITTVHFSAP